MNWAEFGDFAGRNQVGQEESDIGRKGSKMGGGLGGLEGTERRSVRVLGWAQRGRGRGFSQGLLGSL